MKLKVLDLFSGIGGFPLGLERTGGFETVAFCEIDPFCQKVLKKHWPDVRIYDDITNLKYKENVDLVTAGFPCQDISYAGEGAGLTGDRSGLFWYILKTLCMVGRPKLLLENVAGLLSRGLGTVLGALASFGYDTEWHCIRASHVGLQHPRDRLWIIADPQCQGWKGPIAYNGFLGSKRETHSFAGNETIERRLALDISEQCIRKDDGIPVKPHRNRVKQCGNAVVPQIPEMIGYAILEAA